MPNAAEPVERFGRVLVRRARLLLHSGSDSGKGFTTQCGLDGSHAMSL